MAPRDGKLTTKAASSSKPKKPPTAVAPSCSSTSTGDDAIYFWRETERATGYLSQWFDQPFYDRASSSPRKVYKTAEHYMMHHKALLFNDAEIAAQILEADSPRAVKDLGRMVSGFDNAIWDREKIRIVTEGNWCKFTLPVAGAGRGTGGEETVWKLGDAGGAEETMTAPSFRDVLLATGTRELVEASPFDKIWGIKFDAKHAPHNRAKWGLNLLGKCLMDVREQFRKEKEGKIEAETEATQGEAGTDGEGKTGGSES